MVLRETQRAFVYFSLYGLTIDQIIVNRVLPEDLKDKFFEGWRASQQRALLEIEQYFAPVPVRQAPMFRHEVFWYERLRELATSLYGSEEDPSFVMRASAPYSFAKVGHPYEVRWIFRSRRKRRSGYSRKATSS